MLIQNEMEEKYKSNAMAETIETAQDILMDLCTCGDRIDGVCVYV